MRCLGCGEHIENGKYCAACTHRGNTLSCSGCKHSTRENCAGVTDSCMRRGPCGWTLRGWETKDGR